MTTATPRVGLFGALALAAETAHELFLCTARDVHLAVVNRVYGITRLATRGSVPVSEQVHGGVSSVVYSGIGAGVKATAKALHAADRRGLGGRLEATPRGRFAVSAVNGLIGDRLAADRSTMAIEMAVRLRGEDVHLDHAHLAAAFPSATPDVVVFLHGLSESEHYWDRGRHETGGNYGERLSVDLGWTPIFIRANTGLQIADNAVVLAGLLNDLVAAWPTEVRRIALVGHSMGGLILRAACAVVTDAKTPWHVLVTDVVTLGTPHLGAPIERGLHFGTTALGLLPESAPFGRMLEYRSVGILDLRSGLASDVQNLPNARYRLVAATLAGSHRHPLSEMLGDGLVRYPSATGRPRFGRELFPKADMLHIRGDHFDLLNHPEVYDALKTWLG